MRKLGLAVIVIVLSVLAVAQNDKQKEEAKASDVTISVIRDTNGKPVRNAAVVLHPVNDDGKQDSGGINLKTDMEGKTAFQGLPYGKLRIQVIAHGFQTFGDDFDINQPQQVVVVKLKPPSGQFSIYDDKNKQAEPKK
jgi:Carboxypeptidase regulatory-like domain